MSKTGRKRGIVLKMVRSVAFKENQFQLSDIVPPLTLAQARNSLNLLIKKGEIERITAMGPGWWMRAIYKKTDQLRKPEFTNKRL